MLSTPSLGITCIYAKSLRDRAVDVPFNSLSRDHIALLVVLAFILLTPSFNSLSRDHAFSSFAAQGITT